MAYYNYKRVAYNIPEFIIKQQGDDYEGGCDYDGDLWCAAADYIDWLEHQIPNLVELLTKENNAI